MSSATSTDASLRPWQFFLLAGMLCATAVVIVATGQSPASIVILSITVVTASFVALAAYRSLAPLVLPESLLLLPSLFGGRTRAGLEREKTLVLRTIKELEFDFAMGKVSRSDYDLLGGRLRARAIGLIKQIDAGAGYRGVIENELAARTAGMASTAEHTPRTTDDDVATIDDGAHGLSPAITACASCGVSNEPDARFCKNCGTKLAA
ncbi:MAG TPA: zinc ribbon domain-containing protein [Vicinamibacterales bacterium]|nr:zinc ribbon domain-containing protein [Vicinamibacterales bacterium]